MIIYLDKAGCTVCQTSKNSKVTTKTETTIRNIPLSITKLHAFRRTNTKNPDDIHYEVDCNGATFGIVSTENNLYQNLRKWVREFEDYKKNKKD
jgi:hypothetical protein